jgi:hypothetical protein
MGRDIAASPKPRVNRDRSGGMAESVTSSQVGFQNLARFLALKGGEPIVMPMILRIIAATYKPQSWCEYAHFRSSADAQNPPGVALKDFRLQRRV